MLHNVNRRAVTWHRTVGNDFDGNVRVLVREEFEPTLLWDPWSGRIGQFFAADRGSYALKHVGNPPTNTHGVIHVQVEIVDHGRTVSITDTPMKNADEIMHWLLQLGIPETLPAGPMLPLGTHKSCSASTWNKSGHFGHCHVPENDHTDPGRMDFGKLFGLTKPPAPKPQPTPPTPQEDKVQKIIRIKGTAPQYLTDGITRRWIEDPAELTWLESIGLITDKTPHDESAALVSRIPLVGKAP